MPSRPTKPTVLITGAAGAIGKALAAALKSDYRVVGLDLDCSPADFTCIECNVTNDASVELALRKVRDRVGSKLAAVVHLAAYFDFTGKESPLYEAVNVEGTRRLVRALRDFEVERFVFSGTMLVHAPCAPGERINEETPIAPKWAYPKSKARTEAVIGEEAGDMPVTYLHLAGLYDGKSAVPTLSHQIARIYERDVKSRLYAGDTRAGQSMVHKDDAIDAMVRTIERRRELPKQTTILVGESEAIGYRRLQNRIACLIHGRKHWSTITLPKPLAKAGAWTEAKAEPIIPDAIDQGEKPFIRPFMIDMAEDHYALDTSRARELLGWEPKHNLLDGLETIVAALKRDPYGWYEANGITSPPWLNIAAEEDVDAEAVRAGHERHYRRQHRDWLWGAFLNIGLGSWLLASPATLGYVSEALQWSDWLSGAALMLLGCLSLSWKLGPARWAAAAVGLWLLAAPLVFWAPTAAAYNNDTMAGMLAFGFALLVRPLPGISSVADQVGPTVPPGWDFSPSSWFQRLPIIILAFVGLLISRYLAAYQLGHIDGVWEPFFAGAADPKNGTEEIITSAVSHAWPVPDAGAGALVYALEILTGIIGSSRRWRTMPWLVLLFGIMIVPLGIVSIGFIIIQPIVIGTWCTLCLVQAAAMLLQIPYSLDELLATWQFMVRRTRKGHNPLRVLFVGDSDEGATEKSDDDFAQPPGRILFKLVQSGLGVPWNLTICLVIGVWLMTTRLSLGTSGIMADADHLIGSLVMTATVIALADVARAARYLNMLLGVALFATALIVGAGWPELVSAAACGAALIGFSIHRGHIRYRYGR